MSYLVFPHVRVQCANMLGASFLIGGPPVFAAYGLGQALCFRLGGGARVLGVALIHHNREVLGEIFYDVFFPQQRRSASFTFGKSSKGSDYSSKNAHALSLQPVANAHLRVSLVWEVENVTDLAAATRFLHQSRFAGGLVTRHGKVALVDTVTEAFAPIRTGYVVRDRRDLLENCAENQAACMVRTLGEVPDAPRGNTWLAAACVGYAAITEFAHRAGAREGYTHAFAEPLVGMVQYCSLRQWQRDAMLDDAFWRPRWLTDAAWGTFVLQQDIVDSNDDM